MRDAIDRYKDAADRGAFQIKVDSQGYPPDLDTLVKGVDSNGKKMRFLRRIPVDPMTGKTEWGLRSMQDDPTPIPGAGRTCLTCIPSRRARRSTARSTRRGSFGCLNCRLTTMNRRLRQRGFTLIELMVVISIIVILMSVAIPRYQASILRARETVLRDDLYTLRSVIDQYTLDKQKAPQSLQDLVDAGYMKQLPKDPFTNSRDSWVPVTDDSIMSPDQSQPGIIDVHSGSDQNSSEGTAYSTW